MARRLTPRKLNRLDETIRRVETRPLQYQRDISAKPFLGTPGTDFGTPIVPRTTIPKAKRTVQAGSDKFEPGVGTAFLFRVSAIGEIEPRLDSDGNAIWKLVYNFSLNEYTGNDVSLEMQSSSSGSEALETQSGDTFDLQSDAGDVDYIGPTTDVLIAIMDRSGKLCIPPDEKGTGTATTKIARLGGTKIDAFDQGTTTPGTGTVEVWEFNNGKIVDTATTLTAYNSADYDIPKDEFVLIHQEVGDDRWMIDADGENVIKGFTGPDGSEILYPYDAIQIYGDRDAGAPSPALGDIIDVQISKAGIVLGIVISAVGDMSRFRDQVSPVQGTTNVALGDTIDLFTAIDETLLDQFAEFRVTADRITLHAGKVFDVTGNTGDVDIFPLETLEVKGAAGTSVAVSKAANTVTATITAGTAAKIAKTAVSPDPAMAAFDGVDTPGSATVTVWEFTNGTIAATAEMLTAYNMYDYPVPADEWIIIRPEAGDGRWIVDMDGEHVIQGFAAGQDGSQILYPYETLIISGDRDEAIAVGNIIDVTISNLVPGPGVKVKIDATGGLFFFEDQVPTQESIDLGGCVKLDTNVSWADFIITPASTPNPIITLTFADLARILDDAAGDENFAGADKIKFTNSAVTKTADTITVDVSGSANDGKAKVRTTDASAFLEDQFTDHITDGDGDRYASAQDPLVEFQTDPTTAGLEKIRGFINSSDITGYSASGELHLALETNVLKWIAPSAAITWTAAGDSGVNQTISGGDTLTLTGSSGAAAAAAGDRGVTSVGTATDVMVISVDASVLQKIDLSGTATSGTDPVLVSAGTRNQIQIISNTASTVEEAGSKGWIQVVGGAGTIELILHEQTTSGYSFCVSADQGTVEVVNDTDTVEILGSNLTAAGAQADRGVVTVASAGDTITLSVDQTVHQKTALSGTGTSGTTPVLVSAGTRNQLDLISGGIPTTVQEVGSTGYIEIKGDALGGVEFILHEQATTGYSFCVDGDSGPVQVISDSDTFQILGSNLTAAGAQADRGITSVASATDTITLSIDETVLQKIDLQGSAVSGTDPVLVSAGTRNQLNFIANGSSGTVEEAGSKGWIELKGDATGGLEFILHEQVSGGYSFCIEGDKGSTQVITDTNTVDLEGSNLTAASTVARRGVVTTGSAVDTIEFSIDETVAQEINVTGSATTGTSLIQASAGTRNRFDFVSQTASTIEEVGSKGWIELNGDGLGGIEFILHEQAPTSYSFFVDGDQGPAQTITDTNTLLILGSNLTPAAAQADRGVVSVASSTDTVTLSVDQSVHQKTNLSGTGVTGILNVPISAGTRNQLNFISSCTSAVEESGDKGWIELKGDASGGVEFILHEQAGAQYDFIAAGDKGSPQTISDGNTLTFEGSNLTAASACIDRGIVTTAEAVDRISLSVDQSVLQKFLLSGSGQTGTTSVLVKDGIRNQVEFVSTNIPVQSTGDGWIELKGSTSTIELILHQQSLSGAFGIGDVIENSKAPILSGGKRYKDDGTGSADTNWAWMDGTSNASPGSGIDRRNYFVRGTSSTAAVTNTAFGRSETSSTTDDDEVTVAVTVTVDDHTDHVHDIIADKCHFDVAGADTHFDFSTSDKETTIQKQVGGASLTLDHTVNPGVVTITNNSATPNANIEMLPAFKRTHYFEKVA